MAQELFVPGMPTASGGVGERLLAVGGDTAILRPYIAEDGRSYVTMNTGTTSDGKPKYEAVPTTNAATLRKDEWATFDRVVLKAARQRLRAWSDLRAANTYGGFDGMSSMVLEHETMSDPGEAFVDFDGLTEGRRDAPKFELNGLPLPITHSPFWFSSRRLMISRKMGQPLDSVMAEAAGRRVAEEIEKTLIGTVTGKSLSPTNVSEYSATPKVYGYTNFPHRITKTNFTAPTTGGWTPAVYVAELLDMIESLNTAGFYGPFMCYHSTNLTKYMDQDYSGAKGDNLMRDRIRKIDQITDVRRLDYLTTNNTTLLVQMTPDVCRAVNGMDITTVQWESMGGMRVDFKVMAIQVPQLRADINGKTGIAHGTTS
jgi:Family of unknown function (DUF6260)